MGHRGAVIHVNPNMPHQVSYGESLQAGLKAHGVEAVVTTSASHQGEWHICIGPHFALKYWRGAKTLLLDRAYWKDPQCVSVHWLVNGEKHFSKGNPHRDHPELHPMKSGERTIYLCDYGETPGGDYDTVRRHPADKKPTERLEDVLSRHDIAIGRRSTALVDAALLGLRVETSDPHSPVYGLTDRAQWIRDLAWHNWSQQEIHSGDMFDVIGTDHQADQSRCLAR